MTEEKMSKERKGERICGKERKDFGFEIKKGKGKERERNGKEKDLPLEKEKTRERNKEQVIKIINVLALGFGESYITKERTRKLRALG